MFPQEFLFSCRAEAHPEPNRCQISMQVMAGGLGAPLLTRNNRATSFWVTRRWWLTEDCAKRLDHARPARAKAS